MWSYLGQNFLIDSKIKHHIAAKAEEYLRSNKATTLIEVGPWKMAITKHIVTLAPHFFVIEKDDTLLPWLRESLWADKVIHSDVLQRDMTAFMQQNNTKLQDCMIVWNLPYYITSPILRKFFATWQAQSIPCGICMIQKEVADKIVTWANKISYLGRLLQYGYDIHISKTVPPKAFRPAPKVHSAVIVLQAKEKLPDISFVQLVAFLEIFAPYSRKTLAKINKMTWQHYTIGPTLWSLRLEDCTRDNLTQIIHSAS